MIGGEEAAPAEGQVSCAPRATGRPFPKGVSGNPGGRPRGVRQLREKLESHASKIEKALIHALEAPDVRVQLDAAKLCLAYLYGRPGEAQPPSSSPEGTELPMISLAEAEQAMLQAEGQNAEEQKYSVGAYGDMRLGGGTK